MSSIWTPGGEHPVGDDDEDLDLTDPDAADIDPELVEQMQARMAEAQRQLAETPARVVVANHAMGFYELAAIHLSQSPPNFGEATLAIDALALMVEGLEGRLAEEGTLREALAQIRLAFVQIKGMAEGDPAADD